MYFLFCADAGAVRLGRCRCIIYPFEWKMQFQLISSEASDCQLTCHFSVPTGYNLWYQPIRWTRKSGWFLMLSTLFNYLSHSPILHWQIWVIALSSDWEISYTSSQSRSMFVLHTQCRWYWHLRRTIDDILFTVCVCIDMCKNNDGINCELLFDGFHMLLFHLNE